MIQKFTLDNYDWRVKVYYLDGECDMAQRIEDDLVKAGCNGKKLDDAMRLVNSREYNIGLTFSNLASKKSVMVIGKTTSEEECANSIIHERKHLEYHICQAYDIDPFSEDASYLAGELGAKMYKCASILLCSECRKRYLSLAEE